MRRPNRTTTTAVLLVCVLGTQWMGATVFAGGEEAASGAARLASAVTAPLETHQRLVIDVSRFTLADEPSMFAQRGRGFRGRGRNEGARAALVVGTLAAIGGAALLVYANRRRESSGRQVHVVEREAGIPHTGFARLPLPALR